MSGTSTKGISGQLSRGTLVIFVALVGVVIGSLWWSTDRIDGLSIARQSQIARHSIEVALDDLALQQETVAIWDESALRTTRADPDRPWMHRNLTGWLYRMFNHDEVFVLDSSSRPIQASVRGEDVPVGHYDTLKSDVRQVIMGVRGEIDRPNGRHDRNPGRPLRPNTSVRTSERTTHDTHLLLVGGRPAAVSAMLIQPSRKNLLAKPAGGWPILLSVRYLDYSFLADLEDKQLLVEPRFSLTGALGTGEACIPLKTEGGRVLGQFVWTPDLPGHRVMQIMLPTNVAAVTILGLLMLTLIRRLNQSLKERGALEARASHLAYHDSLTGLPNRTLLNERLHKALSGSNRRNVTLLLIDLDRFKQVNDTLGHLAGDKLIRDFGTRLTRIAGPRDTVARLGGDEFAVILSDRQWPTATRELCQAILALFSTPFDLTGTRVFGGASIGAARVDDPTTDATELMRRADVALYRAKAEGRNCARLFELAMDEGARKRTRLESELRDALASGDLAVWRQPQVDRAGTVIGQELLLRWSHPSFGIISPQQVIPLAEDTGLILPIGDWVLEQAALQARQDHGLFTAVNLSPIQLRDQEFAARAIEIFKTAGADPARIELEITEQVLLDESKVIHRSLAKLRQAGFRIALDDFGTGYSSLSYLRRFAVDKIKIDRSFAADIHRSEEARAIIAAIVALGRALRLTIAAEGVETREQAEILIAAGCDQFQGYLFGRPVAVVGRDKAAA